MKKSVLVLSLAALIFASCGEKKKEEVKKEVKAPVEAVETTPESTPATKEAETTTDAVAGDVELGKKLFTEKTCATCHQPAVKVIGPAIKDINKAYTESNGSIVKFLKEESKPIVDTDPGQVAIMKANLDGFVKDLTDKELAALAAYIRSVK
jgi:cytochrome c